MTETSTEQLFGIVILIGAEEVGDDNAIQAALDDFPEDLILLNYPYTLDDLLDPESDFKKAARERMLDEMAEACEDAAVDLIETCNMLGIDPETPVTLAFDEEGFVYALTVEADFDEADDELLTESMEELTFTSPLLEGGIVSPNYLMYLATETWPWSFVKQAFENAFDTDEGTLEETDADEADEAGDTSDT